MTDLVVVGSGIAGTMAALTAARNAPSASITVIEPEPDRFAHETGVIDLLGYTPDGTGPIAEPFEQLQSLPSAHPYSRLGTDTVEEALTLFDEFFGPETATADSKPVQPPVTADPLDSEPDTTVTYQGTDSTSNALVPTCNGHVRPVSRYPSYMAAGLLSTERPLRIVGFTEETHLDASLMADRLDDTLPYDVSSTTIEFPMNLSEEPPAREIATALDENKTALDGRAIRDSLVERLRGNLDVEPRIGFPAVLGLQHSEQIRAEFEDRFNADIFEIPIAPPSIPGLRVRNRLRETLDAADVTVREERPVDFQVSSGRIERLQTETDSGEKQEYDPAAYVLATGGLDTGGLHATQSTVTEPVFDCPVSHPDDREAWTDPAFLGDHEFARFGLEIADDLTVLGDNEQPVYENLRVAGSLIAGWDFTAEHSRGGIAVATGYEAGSNAIDQIS